jgi:ParB family chromosome partitioning protein
VTSPAPGIGRGLAAILSVSRDPDSEDAGELRELPLELIAANPRQPRRRFPQDALASLAASVEERGVLQPVLVRPRVDGTYELIAGERRLRAAQLAQLQTIPALVRARADAEVLELALIENMAREDLSPIEEARACAALIEELDLTREEVARRVGRSRVAVSNLMRLLDLPEEVIDLLQEGRLSEGHGRALLLASEHETRRSLARQSLQQGWSVRTLEARARASNSSSARANGVRARRRITGAHPDQEHAAQEIAEALAEALGAEVRVRASGARGYRAELTFESSAEALELARRLRARRAS